MDRSAKPVLTGRRYSSKAIWSFCTHSYVKLDRTKLRTAVCSNGQTMTENRKRSAEVALWRRAKQTQRGLVSYIMFSSSREHALCPLRRRGLQR